MGKMDVTQRDGHGFVEHNGVPIGRVNPHESLFQLVSHPGFTPGMDFTRDPDWIYIDGVKARKRLTKVGDDNKTRPIYVWLPALKDLDVIAERYNRVRNAALAGMRKWQAVVRQIDAAGGKAHCRVTHRYEGDGRDGRAARIDPWWIYRVSERGVGFDWTQEPSDPINLELGTALYELDNRKKDLWRRAYKFEHALRHAIEAQLFEVTGTEFGYTWDDSRAGERAVVRAGGLDYLYSIEYTKDGALRWTLFGWPYDGKPTHYINHPNATNTP